MPKHFFLFVLVAVFLPCADVPAQAPRSTIAFVDYEQVFTNFFKTKLANDQLNEMLESINRERAIMMAQFETLQTERNVLREGMIKEGLDEAARQNLRRRMDTNVADTRRLEERISTFNEAQARRWDEQNRRIRGNLMAEIRDRLASFYKARGFLAVVDLSQANEKGVPAVLYLDERADITRDAIIEVNKPR